MRFAAALLAAGAFLFGSTQAQQYAGDVINTTCPGVPGAEVAYWKIKDPQTGSTNNTLVNYINHGKNGARLDPLKIKRAVVIIHGLNRDPGTYMANMLSALSQVTTDSNITTDSVAIVAPWFPNGADKNDGSCTSSYCFPWITVNTKKGGIAPGQGSYTNILVWSGSQWSAGGNNQYPISPRSSTNISSYDVLDQMVQYFDNTTMFPNMNQIVIAGHSLGAQTVQRYAAIGKNLGTHSPVVYWCANPNSYVWLSTDRPLSTASCSIYDDYREGYNNFVSYPMTYGTDLVAQGRPAIRANFNQKQVAYARGTQDLGDDSSSCAPETTGSNRNERFFNFIKAFPPSCPDPTGSSCDTVDFVATGHDGGAMMASLAGQARLFKDNFYGNGNRSYDFGYPRQQAGDDPYPNPALNGSTASANNNTYAGNMTYWGCWSDQSARTLTHLNYQNNSNTIELCTSACYQAGYRTAGMENGDQCFCDNNLGYLATQVIESSCQTACAGNSSEVCGGANRLSLFSNSTPVVNAAPGTPETIGAGWTEGPCYTDNNGGRALAGKSTTSSKMTLELCGTFCTGYKYFGTEYAQECYCGNSFAGTNNITDDSNCNMLCLGDSTEFCGASNYLTTYVNTTWVASSSSSTSTSSAASATSTVAGPSCPASNNTIVTSGGKNFTIECGIDHSGGDLTSLSTNTFQGCIDACAQNSACVDVSLSGSACYLKQTVGASVSSSGIWGAKLVTSGLSSSSSSASSSTSTGTSSSVSGSTTSSGTASTTSSSATSSATAVGACPGSNSTNVISNGKTFIVECGIDHSGGDIYSLSSNFQGCIDACATYSGRGAPCVDVSLSGSACYLKGSVGAAVNNGVWGARLIGSASSSSSSVASTSSSTSSSTVSTSTVTSTTSSSTSSSTADSTTSSSSSSTVSTSSVTSTISSSTVSTSSADPTTSSSTSSTSSAQSTTSSTSTVSTSTASTSTSSPTSSSTSSSTASSTSSTASSSTASSTSSTVSTSTASSTSSTSSYSVSSTFSTVTSSSISSTSSTSSVTSTPSAVSCPASNSTYYTVDSATFYIECGIDHAGGDLSSKSVSNFAACIQLCADTTGCVDVSKSGSACYLKKSLGKAIYNGVSGARLVTGAELASLSLSTVSSTTSTSTASSTPSSA